MSAVGERVLWLKSWSRVGSDWMFRALCERDSQVVECDLPAAVMEQSRAYDLEALVRRDQETAVIDLDLEDIATLAPLLDAAELLRPLQPRLRDSRHDIFVAHAAEDMPVYIPAALLIGALWLWTDTALPALMTPNSLALYLGRPANQNSAGLIRVVGGLSSHRFTDIHLRRVAWLGVDAEARASWSSVLTAAYAGRISLRLPHARLGARAWGMKVGNGLLVSELMSVYVDFWLPTGSLRIQMGRTERPCPPAPPYKPKKVRKSREMPV